MTEPKKPSLSPALQALYTNQGEALNRAIRMQVVNLTPEMYDNFNQITSRYPGMSKDLIMAMVQQGLNANTPGIDKIVSLDGIAQLKKDQFNVETIKKTVGDDKGVLGTVWDYSGKKVYDVFKGATRFAFAGLRYPYDLLTTITRDKTVSDPNVLLKDAATLGGRNTQLGSLIADVFGGKPGLDTGSGFFINPESNVGKAQANAMAAYGKINGDSFTIGRHLASTRLGQSPGTAGYQVLSGLVDASLNIALSPDTWFGPGAIGKVVGGGKKLTEAKKLAEPFSPVAQAEKLTAEIKPLAEQRDKLIGQYIKRTTNSWMRKASELERLEAQKYAIAAPKIETLLNAQEDSFKAFSSDEFAQEVLSNDKLVREVMSNPKTYSGELLRAIGKLSSESNNTKGFTDGYLVLDEVPETGRISIAAHRLDEYFVTKSGDEPLKALNLTEDMAAMPAKAQQAEQKRRAAFEAYLDAAKNNPDLAPEVRAVFEDISKTAVADNMQLNGFSWALPLGETPKTLGSIIKQIADNSTLGSARAMEYALAGILKIWKPDIITNIRYIYGETGGVMVINAKRIAAKNAEVGNAIAELADPTTMGPNMAKLLGSIKTLDEKIAVTRRELDDTLKKKTAAEQRVKELDLFRQITNQDLELRKAIINDPEYRGLYKKIVNIESDIAEKRILREWYQNDVGLVNGYKGDLATDFSKAFKFMLGRRFAQIAEVVAKETDVIKVDNFFGKKLDKEMVVELTAAKTADDVYRIFLSHLGNPTTDPKIFRSTTLRKEALSLVANPMGKVVRTVPLGAFKKLEDLEKAFHRYYVRSTALNLADLNHTINGIEDWISSAQIRTVLGKEGQEKYIDDIKRKLFKSTSEQERAKIIQDGMDNIVEALSRRVGVDESTIDELKSVIKVNAMQKNADTTYTVGKLSENGEVTVMMAGDEVVKLDGGIAYYQLAQGTIFLPDSREVVKALSRYQKNALVSTYKAGKMAVEEIGDIWRTAQLVFRVSYILRNIAEMQMRQLFSGHANIFSHPMQFIAMVMANSGRGGKLVERYARYQYDLAGNAFKNVDAEGEFLEAIRGYQMWSFRRASVSDYRSNRGSEVFKTYRVVGSADKNFFEGLAHTLNRWGSDPFNPKIAKLMLSGDDIAKRQFVTDIINDFDTPNSYIRNYVLGIYKRNEGLKNVFLKDAGVSIDNITKDDLSPEKIFTFFFDDAQEHTLAGQMRAIAGNGPKSHVIMDLLADGKVTFANSAGRQTTVTLPWFEGPMSSNQLSALETAFRKSLKDNFTPEDLAGSRVLFEKQSLVGAPSTKVIRDQVDNFFNLSAQLESKFNFGPEYQMAYWDHVGRYVDMLSLDDLKYVQKQAIKSLAPLGKVINGKYKVLGRKHPTLRVIDSALKKRLKNPDAPGGNAKWQTIHQMAAKNANTYVKELFYDASRQKQWANAWRLIFPFAQAWSNTVYKWAELAAAGGGAPIYRVMKAYDAATKPGSNVIYDVTGMSYDEDQGFIYRDPGSDEPKFKFPIVGSVIGALAGRSLDMRNALQVTAPVQSLNLAFGTVNPLLPGVGPAAQVAFMALGGQDKFGAAWDITRDIVMPFGPPQNVTDIVFPSWFRKTVLYGLGDNPSIQRGAKDWASYLATSGRYGDNPLADDQTRNRLFNDAERLSQSVGWMSALFQSISPATPITEVLTKVKDQDNKYKFMTMSILYENWDRISKANPGDNASAVREFAQRYGANNLLVTLGGTTSAVRGTEDAWTWLNKNPGAADIYATSTEDIVPYFFPGGEASIKYYNWQKLSGVRRKLSTSEIASAAESLVYSMVKDQLVEQQIAAGYPEYWLRDKIAELDKQFGGRPSETVTTNTAGEKIAKIGQALQDPAFKQSPVYSQAVRFYDKFSQYREILNKTQGSNYAQFTAKGGMATMFRQELISLAEQLMTENPAFSRMYFGVFAGQLEG